MEQNSKAQRNKNIKTALVLWIIVALIIVTFFVKHWG
jgi:predicted nucleic acid-binding Zn ribbon protein